MAADPLAAEAQEALARWTGANGIQLGHYASIIEAALVRRGAHLEAAAEFERSAEAALSELRRREKESLPETAKARTKEVRERDRLRKDWVTLRAAARSESDHAISQAKLFLTTTREALIFKKGGLGDHPLAEDDEVPLDESTRAIQLRRARAERTLAEATKLVPEMRNAVRSA